MIKLMSLAFEWIRCSSKSVELIYSCLWFLRGLESLGLSTRESEQNENVNIMNSAQWTLLTKHFKNLWLIQLVPKVEPHREEGYTEFSLQNLLIWKTTSVSH